LLRLRKSSIILNRFCGVFIMLPAIVGYNCQ
jgi:hypothetical protein